MCLPHDPEVRRFTVGNIVNSMYNQPGPASGLAFSVMLSLTQDTP